MELKAFFIIFKGLVVARKCLRPNSEPLNQKEIFLKYFPFQYSLKSISLPNDF